MQEKFHENSVSLTGIENFPVKTSVSLYATDMQEFSICNTTSESSELMGNLNQIVTYSLFCVQKYLNWPTHKEK